MALDRFLANGYNIVLDPNGKEVDSYEFSNLFKNRARVNIFIGGAFGFERAFLNKCNSCISFGKITMSHKLTKVVLLEQIFRALSILNNHPYHK
jgi:23S rRNA (pseudouridine1915-N3)-methyltransferase